MDGQEAERILLEFSTKYIFTDSYRSHLYGADITTRRNAVNFYSVELPPEESLEGLCIVVFGSSDNLPADAPKPENPYQGLLVVYDKTAGPFEHQKNKF